MEVLLDSFKQGIAPAIVVAIYLIVIKVIDNRKELVQTKLNTNLIQSINEISNFVITITNNIVNKDIDKCKIAIEDSMNAAGMRLTKFVASTIINNHIDNNKETILTNIHNIVNAEYYSVYSTLSMYTINNKKVSDALHNEWIEAVEKDMIDVIYNKCLDDAYKILSFSNKIDIKFQSYITYIINTIN